MAFHTKTCMSSGSAISVTKMSLKKVLGNQLTNSVDTSSKNRGYSPSDTCLP